MDRWPIAHELWLGQCYVEKAVTVTVQSAKGLARKSCSDGALKPTAPEAPSHVVVRGCNMWALLTWPLTACASIVGAFWLDGRIRGVVPGPRSLQAAKPLAHSSSRTCGRQFMAGPSQCMAGPLLWCKCAPTCCPAAPTRCYRGHAVLIGGTCSAAVAQSLA